MKKIIVGIVVFAIVAVGVTAGLIKNRNENYLIKDNVPDQHGQSGENIQINQEENKKTEVVEKTLDVYGTYDENDLIIEKVPFTFPNERIIEIPQIKGLKNKEIENKINEDIKNKIQKEIDATVAKYSEYEYSAYFETCANFSNILSLSEIVYLKNTDLEADRTVCMNYNLANGNELKFEDLFKQNADMESVVRKAIYRYISHDNALTIGESDMGWQTCVGDLRYDEKRGAYFATVKNYPFKNTEDMQKHNFVGKSEKIDYNDMYLGTGEMEFIPVLTDYEVNKLIKKYLNSEDKKYTLTPRKLSIFIDQEYTIEFEKIADEVVIYDKYLTDQGLYEAENIGFKNLLTCSLGYHNHYEYRDYSFEGDNFFSDFSISTRAIYGDDYPYEEELVKCMESVKEESYRKIDGYRKKADSDPNNFYIITIAPTVYGIENNGMYTNLIQLETVETIDIRKDKTKKEVVDIIIEDYRYEWYVDTQLTPLRFYESNTKTEQYNYKLFNVKTQKEITDVSELFKEGVDYIGELNRVLRLELANNWRTRDIPIEQREEIIKQAKYEINPGFNNSPISINIDTDTDTDIEISLSSLDSSLLSIFD